MKRRESENKACLTFQKRKGSDGVGNGGIECISEASRIMNFNEFQEEKGRAILEILKGLSVENGIEILEKCIFQHAYFGWEREYMTEPFPYGIGPVKDKLPQSDESDEEKGE